MNMIQGEKKKVLLPLSDREEEIGRLIVNAAYKVHSSLGPGLLEKIYEICFVHELKKSGLNAVRQVDVSINYDGMIFDDCLRKVEEISLKETLNMKRKEITEKGDGCSKNDIEEIQTIIYQLKKGR